MVGKAKSRCCLGMQEVNNLRHIYFNVMKLENYSPNGKSLTVILAVIYRSIWTLELVGLKLPW